MKLEVAGFLLEATGIEQAGDVLEDAQGLSGQGIDEYRVPIRRTGGEIHVKITVPKGYPVRTGALGQEVIEIQPTGEPIVIEFDGEKLISTLPMTPTGNSADHFLEVWAGSWLKEVGVTLSEV